LIYLDIEPVYEAYRYAADGHAGELDPADPEMSDGAVLVRGTLEECRRAVARRIATSLETARWRGLDGDVEAYHESDQEGCGGWAIRPVR
jgi:hypothetical protein